MSNRMEVLAGCLIDVLETPLASPLVPEIIVVQSKGMEKWISLEAANRLGVCANIRFPFPNAFVYDLFKYVFPDLPETDPFDPGIAVWRIMKHLFKDSERLEKWDEVRNYLGDGSNDVKRYQLALQLARLFDQYVVFRPDMVLKWEDGKDGGWQGDLFRDISEHGNGLHRARLAKTFVERIKQGAGFAGVLPERISLFGVSYLPPFHLRILEAAASVIEVNIFVMNPCREYWAEITSVRDERRIEGRYRSKAGEAAAPDDLHMERGNSLLASMGRMGRDFFNLAVEAGAEEYECFETPDGSNLLAQIQSDILTLVDRAGNTAKKSPVSEDDHSISIHICHSPLREMETLQNNLLAMFEEDEELEARDVIVMTPDIEKAAPYIQAVFNLPKDDLRYIPYSIADRSALSEGKCVRAFLDILRIGETRYGAAPVMEILETPAVYRKFELAETDLDNVREWIKDTEIRWGIDGAYRNRLDLPEIQENTWKHGMDRLLLGYALPAEGQNMFNEVLPYDNIEGGEGRILGGLAEFTHQLFKHTKALETSVSPKEWNRILSGLVNALFKPDMYEESEINTILEVIKDLEHHSKIAGFDGTIDLKGVQAYLNQRLDDKKQDFRFLTGGVTFCAMLPMRSIPFKAVCLTGMDTDAFPGKSGAPGFDRMASSPQTGDRSPRDEDRYLFLEAILSARKWFYISYTGRHVRENSEIPPSVLVDDLLDYIQDGFEIPGKSNIRDHILTEHKLQAFNPAYFRSARGRSKLFSYSSENLSAAKSLLRGGVPRPAFISGPLGDPEPEFAEVSIRNLYQFFINPCKYLLNNRLSLYFEKIEGIREDAEPFELDWLQSYLLSETIAAAVIEGSDPDRIYDIKKAAGELPHGEPGRYIFTKNRENVSEMADKVSRIIDPGNAQTIEIDLRLDGYRIVDRVRLPARNTYIRYRYAKVKAKDRLWVWLTHLLLNAQTGGSIESFIVGKDRSVYLKPVEDSEMILKNLLDIFWKGLKGPLPFFPESSLAFAETSAKDDELRKEVSSASPDAALANALKKWKGNKFAEKPGECEDPYFQTCFKHCDPFNEEFMEIANCVYRPLIDAQEDVKL